MILNIICDLKSYTSREYTKLSIDSFDPLIQKGYVKEIKLKTYIPTDSLNSRKIHNYSKHLSFGQRNQSFEPTEISLQETHIELWKETKDDSDINWILEHDAYLLPERVDDAMKLLDRIHEVDPYYANIGLFTCFYRVNNDAIKMLMESLEIKNLISCYHTQISPPWVLVNLPKISTRPSTLMIRKKNQIIF
jgi:hypothetical protein